MKSFFPLFLSIFMIAVIQSCTVEKRLYSKGFHIEWNKQFRGASSGKAQKEQISMEDNSLKPELVEGGVHVIELQDSVDQIKPISSGSQRKEKYQSIWAVKKRSPESSQKRIGLKQKEQKIPKAGSFISARTVLALFLILFVLIPALVLLVLVLGESLEVLLIWFFIILAVALIGFFIARMVVTAVRY